MKIKWLTTHPCSFEKGGARALVLALILLLCPLAMSHAQDNDNTDSALQISRELASNIAELESRIAGIQSEQGPFDTGLLQPLDMLTRMHMETENFQVAAQLLNQQMQIHRINSGLYSAQQIPIVESLLQMQAQAGDWRGVNDSLSNLSWLYQRNTTLDAETQLDGLQALGNWHLRALEKDTRERQAYHLVALAEIEERTAQIAQSHLGADNPSLSPYLYNQALADIYIALAITLTSETSQDLMQLTEGIRNRPSSLIGISSTSLRTAADLEAAYGSKASTVIERSFRKNIGDGIEKLERIKEIYVKSGNIEAEAMALMYLGDATLIRHQFEDRPGNFAGVERGSSSIGTAIVHYREALARFADAGIGTEAITEFTRCPVMLPIPKFHETLRSATSQCEQIAGSEALSLGDYNLVATLIPGIEGDAAGTDEVINARVKFSVRTNGQVSDDDVETIEPDDTASRVQIRKLLDIMQFRPAISNAEAMRSEQVLLNIRIPSAD